MKTFSYFLFLVSVVAFSACKKEITNEVPIAEAGDAQMIQLPLDSVTLNGKGSDADGQVVAYLWSEISGPGHPIIMDAGSPSTLVKCTKEGVYIFQLMVVDNAGATGTDTVSITVTPPEIVNLTLSPANNPNEVHIWGSQHNEASYVGSPEIGGVAWTYYGDQIAMRAALKFDLSSIPSNATILSAKLALYSNPTPLNGDISRPNSGDDNTLLIQRIISDWTPGTVKWINQPAATTDGEIIIPHTSSPTLDLNIDVSDFIQSIVSNNSNYGFLIRLKTENIYNSRIFCSSYYKDASKHPKLVIEYRR